MLGDMRVHGCGFFFFFFCLCRNCILIGTLIGLAQDNFPSVKSCVALSVLLLSVLTNSMVD